VSLNFRWRFGKKWSLWGHYWATSNSGEAILKKNIAWEDVVFKAGTYAAAGIDLDVARVFFGREFDLGPEHELGVGVGLHYLSLGTLIEGEIITGKSSTRFYRAKATADFPLPNIGGWYMYSWSPRWMFQTRVDWLSASIGAYSGSMWDVQAGFNYQAFKNIGLGLYYKGFLLDVEIEKRSWRGGVDLKQNGPLLTFTATW